MFVADCAHFTESFTGGDLCYKKSTIMTHNSFSPALHHAYVKPAAHQNIVQRFINWCNAQQQHRLLWMGVILALHGCVLTPVAMLLSLQAGAGNFLFVGVIAAMVVNLVPNLAALPTKITIPVFFLSILVDVLVVLAAMA